MLWQSQGLKALSDINLVPRMDCHLFNHLYILYLHHVKNRIMELTILSHLGKAYSSWKKVTVVDR